MTTHRCPPRARCVCAALLAPWLAAAGCAVTLPEPTPAPRGEPVAAGAIVAKVNGVPIPASRLERAAGSERLQLLAQGPRPEAGDGPAHRRYLMELLIGEELLYQAALASGLEVPATEIDERFRGGQSQFATREEFEAHLGSSRRERIERALLVERYALDAIRDVQVDEAEARALYEQHPERCMTQEQVRAAHVLIRVKPGATPAQRWASRKRIQEAYRRATGGEAFELVVREYSDAGAGPAGFVSKGSLFPDMDQALFATEIGGITPIYETAAGYGFAKVLERRAPRLQPFDRVRTGLLMDLTAERRHEALRRHLARLRDAADVVIVDPELR